MVLPFWILHIAISYYVMVLPNIMLGWSLDDLIQETILAMRSCEE